MSMACSFTFQGIGRAVFPLVLVVARTAVVVSACIVLTIRHAPVWSIFVAMAVGNVTSSAILYWRLRGLLGRA
jgi:Na+-driven multidrug efflux pump